MTDAIDRLISACETENTQWLRSITPTLESWRKSADPETRLRNLIERVDADYEEASNYFGE